MIFSFEQFGRIGSQQNKKPKQCTQDIIGAVAGNCR